MVPEPEEDQMGQTQPLKRLSPGTPISHYKIIEEIGAGGMGVVYKAEDTKLKRHVALKFLPPYLTQDPGAKQRFVHEAQAASALDHNNICAIHEIDETDDGQMFISMACYEGETLRRRIEQGPLEFDEALNTALQISEGLAKAHEKGIVHRDVKPANIMITKDGVVKIMDFGLAKLAGQTRITRTGTTMGTVAYMSPEQVQGQEVDERSDIFSLGVVLYEMITGRSPFKAEYEATALYSIVHEEPEPLSLYRPAVPEELQHIVEKALSKDVSSRYQSSADLLADLRRLKEGRLPDVVIERRAASRRRKVMRVAYVAVAVMAFLALLSRYIPPEKGGAFLRRFLTWGSAVESVPEIQEERFVVVVAPFWGTTEKAKEEGKVMQALIDRQLRTELAGEPAVSILSEEVSEVPRSHEDAQALGETLDAAVVIWGEVLALHEEVEIQPYLTYLKRDAHPSDPAMAGLVANLAEPSQLTLRKAEAEEIGDIALLAAARYYMWRAPDKALAILERISTPTSESVLVQAEIAYVEMRKADAESLYIEAASLDPSNPWPLNNLAWMYTRQGRHDAAVSLVERGLAVDPENQQLYHALAAAYLGKGEGEKAISLFQELVEQDPDDSQLHTKLGWVYYSIGRLDEAIEEHKEAIRLDPENGYAYSSLAGAYQRLDSLDQAVENYKEAVRLGEGDADFAIHLRLGEVYSRQGKYEEAVSECQKAIALAPTLSYGYHLLGRVLVGLGEPEAAGDAIEQIRDILARKADDARIHIRLGALYSALKRTADVLRELKEAIRLDPDNGDAYYGLGLAYESVDSLDQAALNYEQAIRLGTAEVLSFAAHQSLGSVYSKQGKYEEAVDQLQKAITLCPTYASNYSALAMVHFRQGEYDEVIEAAQQAVALSPRDSYSYSHVLMGAVYTSHGRYEEAISEYRQSVEADSYNIYRHLWYFIALHRGDRSEDGQAHLAQLAKTLKGDSWETALVRFYTGEIGEEALLKLTESEDPEGDKGRKCEAYYYLGMAYLLDLCEGLKSASPDTAKARTYFERGLATEMRAFTEYTLAKNEMALLQKAETED